MKFPLSKNASVKKNSSDVICVFIMIPLYYPYCSSILPYHRWMFWWHTISLDRHIFILIFFEQQYILIFYTERAHEYSLYPPPTILATSGLRRSKLGQRPVYLKTVFWVFKGCCWILLWKATLTFRKCVYFSGLKKIWKTRKTELFNFIQTQHFRAAWEVC